MFVVLFLLAVVRYFGGGSPEVVLGHRRLKVHETHGGSADTKLQQQEKNGNNTQWSKAKRVPFPVAVDHRHVGDNPEEVTDSATTNEWCRGGLTLRKELGPRVALASYQGSGNTWLRYLVEQATGRKGAWVILYYCISVILIIPTSNT